MYSAHSSDTGGTHVLSKDEKRRASRFVVPQAAAEFEQGRVLLRGVLGEKLGIAPQNVAIEIDAFGRPFVPEHSVFFSLSHSGGEIRLAVADRRVGIDIQVKDRSIEEGMTAVFATAREQAWVDSEERFYDLWVRKEAVLKCVGTGFRVDPRSIELLDQRSIDMTLPNGAPCSITVARIEAPPGALAALAVEVTCTAHN